MECQSCVQMVDIYHDPRRLQRNTSDHTTHSP